MKKYGIILLALAITACANKIEEQKFVNPIFYKVMNPLSTGTWYTQITPTEMFRSNKGTDLKQKCTLIENTMEAVTLQCEGPNPDHRDYIILYSFVLVPENKAYGAMLVRVRYRSPNELEEFTSQESLTIPYNN